MAEHPKRLRVAVISVHACPLAALGSKKAGGMNVYVRELSRELARRGHQVDVFTRQQEGCDGHLRDHPLCSSVEVVHIPSGPRDLSAGIGLFPHLAEFVAGVSRFADQSGRAYDVIHSHYWLSGWVGIQLRGMWGTPLIQMFHTLGQMKNRVARADDPREPDLRINTEQEIVQSADTLIAATQAERIQLMWLYGAKMRKIKVVPPGVDTALFWPVPRSEARNRIGMPDTIQMVLYVGRIEPLKGIDTLMQAVSILRSQSSDGLKDVCLCVIGGEAAADEDAEIARLRMLSDELGLGDVVKFLGPKDQQAIRDYYAAAEVVVMPSSYESFGMVALEAMACGTPVIASEIGGLAYLIQDGVTGFHVPDREPEELADKIRLILQNPELREEMSTAGSQYARSYAWPAVTSQIERVYLDSLKAASSDRRL